MGDAKQPDNLCSVCRFDHNGHCLADPKTDWCMKALLTHTVQAAPSDREKRLEAALRQIMSEDTRRLGCGAIVYGFLGDIARAALADTTNNDGG